MVFVGLLDEEKLACARRNRDAVRRRVLDDVRVAVEIRVVDVEEMVLRIARVEGDRQQPALAARPDGVRDVEERARGLPTTNHHDRPFALDDVQRRRVARGGGHVDRLVEAGRERVEGVRAGRSGRDECDRNGGEESKEGLQHGRA